MVEQLQQGAASSVVEEEDHEDHGYSVAMWTAVGVLFVASVVMSVATIIANVPLFIVGAVIAVAGVIAGVALAKAGYGNQHRITAPGEHRPAQPASSTSIGSTSSTSTASAHRS